MTGDTAQAADRESPAVPGEGPVGGPGGRTSSQKAQVRSRGEAAAVCVIVAGALAIRLWGVGRGLPYVHEWDEPLVLTWVIGMLQRGDINPSTFAYPNAYYYMLLPVVHLWYFCLHLRGRIASPWDIQLFHPQGAYAHYWWYISYPSFYVWGRVLTVCLGTATVFLVYRIGAVLFDPAVGLVAAAILAVAPGTIYYADTVRVDVPMMFFLMLAILAGIDVWRRGVRRDYSRAGLLAGLAVSTKPNAFWVAVPLFVAHLLNTTREGVIDRRAVRMALFTVLGFVIGTPFALAQVGYFLDRMSQNAAAYGGFPSPAMMRIGVPLYLGYLAYPQQGAEWYVIPHVGFGLAPAVAALVGAIVGFFWRPKAQAYLLSFPVVYFIYTSGQRFLPLRYILPVLPFMALFAAVGAVWIWQWLRPRWSVAPAVCLPALAAAGVVVLLLGPVRDSIALARALAGDRDTRA
ncbi:MAG TPA: glycosyltransferase family 39 protein, partial [bacterium]|nr:glycosyltransferase family 39 protein [bacterium]